MFFRIDTTSSIPVYAQIVDQVKRAIASGALASGDPLPSLRETAVRLRINPLTVGKAYKELEQSGLIETRQGRGSFVTWNGVELSEQYRRESVARVLDNLITDARNLGLGFDEVKRIFEERLTTAVSERPDGSENNGE